MTAQLPLTKYHRIYLVLREQLQEGLFSHGLPAELELARQYGVGRVTIRHAMERLVADGLIVRVAGRGTFPRSPERPAGSPIPGVQARPTRLAGLMENIVSASRATTVKVLREQLQEGLFSHGLPAELELARQYGVGRVTIRHAMERLVADGLIVRVAGRGTFPRSPERPAGSPIPGVQARPTRLAGLMENIVSASRATTVKVLDWRTIDATESVASALQIVPGTPVRKAIRRRSSREGPLSYITTYMPQSLLAGVSRRDLAGKPLLQLLQESGVELGRAQQTIAARQADALVAQELGVAIGTALLAVRRLVFDAQDRPVQWLEGLYRPDRYEYHMEVSRIGGVDARISVKEPDGAAQSEPS